ncbi:MAG TPA: DUF2283 domain-containing protein [Leifsonia sp.]|jgi:uncharacterized protein YuzE|nr:DUF2283 domain-containing protein [Leifsonia sp.]
MQLTYDPDLDVAYLRLDTSPEAVAADRAEGVAAPFGGSYADVEYDADGYLVGVEILGAAQVVRPEVLATAERVSRS